MSPGSGRSAGDRVGVRARQIRGGHASPRAARMYDNLKAYFRPRSDHTLGFGNNPAAAGRGRDPSRAMGPRKHPGPGYLRCPTEAPWLNHGVVSTRWVGGPE